MNIDDKKINVDDISFEDMLGDGIETEPEVQVEPEVEEEKVETNEDDRKDDVVLVDEALDNDAKIRKEEANVESKKATPEKEDKSGEVAEAETEETLDDSIVGSVLSTLGYEVDDAYEDTTEGLVALTKDVGAQMAEDQLDQLFEKYPLIKEHLNYVSNGGESQNFMTMYDPRSDYSKIKVTEDDVQLQKYVLGEYFKTKGHDKTFIEGLLEDYEDSGKLHAKASQAKEALAQTQAKQRASAIEQQRRQQAQQMKEQKDFWNGVHKTIDESQEFKGIKVADREKRKFFDYLSKPVTKEGYTQRDLDHSESDMDVKLAIDYLMFKGFNLDKLIDKKARTKSVKSLKDKIKSHKETLRSAKTTKKTKTNVDIDDLDLSLF